MNSARARIRKGKACFEYPSHARNLEDRTATHDDLSGPLLLPASLSAAICCAVSPCGSAASRRDRPCGRLQLALPTGADADWSRQASMLLSCFERAGPCGLGRHCHSGGGWTESWRFFCFIAVGRGLCLESQRHCCGRLPSHRHYIGLSTRARAS